MYIKNSDINPGFAGTMHCCKAPLWGGRLELGSLNLTPRFAHRLKKTVVAAGKNMGSLCCRLYRPAQQVCTFWCRLAFSTAPSSTGSTFPFSQSPN